MATTTTTTTHAPQAPNPLDGLTPDQLAHAVRLLRPARPTALTPASVTLQGTFRAVTVLDSADVAPEPGTVGITVAQLKRLHDAGEGQRFGDKPCPFCG